MKRLLPKSAFWLSVLLIMILAAIPPAAKAATRVVTSAADDGPGTLREALTIAGVGDTITFSAANFPANIAKTIMLLKALPPITRAGLIIDGSSANVILDGSRAGGGTNGLTIDADTCVVRGLTIRSFSSNGIVVKQGASGNTIGGDRTQGSGPNGQGNLIIANGGSGIEINGSGADFNIVRGNFIGIDETGRYAQANVHSGVAIFNGAQHNTIGGTTNGFRNVISGNGDNGVWISNANTSQNLVIGNYIGTTADGNFKVKNELSGVSLQNGTSGNTVGGTVAGAGNLISGNKDNGIYMSDAGTNDNRVLGNIIGPDAQGTMAVGHDFHGVMITLGASNNFIGDGSVAGRNLISANAYDGVHIEGVSTAGNRVQGNYIGTTITGAAALGNRLHGIEINNGAHDNLIGGSAAGQGNLLSGNLNHGVVIHYDAHHNTVIGNLIGPNAAGTQSLGNGPFGGIDIAEGAHDNTIGGGGPGERNVISGNQTDGIALFDNTGKGTRDNKIIGNWIGLTRDGLGALPNTGFGIANISGAIGTRIQGNRVAYNEGHGVWVGSAARTLVFTNTIWLNQGDGVRVDTCAGNTITRNSIYNNKEKGIRSVCPAAPAITAAVTGATETVTVTTTPDATVEVFSDDDDEGRIFEVAGTANGAGVFSYSKAGEFARTNLTATSTDTNGNTSEFSLPAHLQWTMLLYLNGDNNLDTALANTLNNVMVARNPRANVLALLDRAGPSGSKLYDLTRSPPVVLSSSERNMGDGQTLVDFVAAGRTRYPARHVMLAVVDHGGGWAPSPDVLVPGGLPRPRIGWLAGSSGLSWDEFSDYAYLDTKEISQTLHQIRADGGPVDVLFFDACLMGMIEVAYQIKGTADFFVSSQNIGWAPVGSQGRYVRAIQDLPPRASPLEMANLLVRSYADSMPDEGHPYTVAALDMSRLQSVASATDQLAAALAPNVTNQQEAAMLLNVYTATQKIDYDTNLQVEAQTDGFVDLYDFAQRIALRYNNSAIDVAANSVMTTLDTLIVAEAHRSGRPWMQPNTPEWYWDLDGLKGLSIFLPLGEDLELPPPPDQPEAVPQANLRLRDTYIGSELGFVRDTRWKSLIDAYYAAVNVPPGVTNGPVKAQLPPDITPPQTTATFPITLPIGQRLRITWQASDAQSGVAGAKLIELLPGGAWVSKETQFGVSGSFEVASPARCASYAVLAFDKVGNTEAVDPGVNSRISTCIFLVTVRR
jgi:hypothetical protein